MSLNWSGPQAFQQKLGKAMSHWSGSYVWLLIGPQLMYWKTRSSLYFIEFVDLILHLAFYWSELQDYKVLTWYADAQGGGDTMMLLDRQKVHNIGRNPGLVVHRATGWGRLTITTTSATTTTITTTTSSSTTTTTTNTNTTTTTSTTTTTRTTIITSPISVYCPSCTLSQMSFRLFSIYLFYFKIFWNCSPQAHPSYNFKYDIRELIYHLYSSTVTNTVLFLRTVFNG